MIFKSCSNEGNVCMSDTMKGRRLCVSMEIVAVFTFAVQNESGQQWAATLAQSIRAIKCVKSNYCH